MGEKDAALYSCSYRVWLSYEAVLRLLLGACMVFTRSHYLESVFLSCSPPVIPPGCRVASGLPHIFAVLYFNITCVICRRKD